MFGPGAKVAFRVRSGLLSGSALCTEALSVFGRNSLSLSDQILRLPAESLRSRF
jgi:hypothetical protein